MTAGQFIGYAILQTSAITSLLATSTASVWHGMRPKSTLLPSVNYFALPGQRFNGFESVPWSVNCRAQTIEAAMAIQRAVGNLFSGTASTGIYGAMNGFSIGRGSVPTVNGVIPEPEDNVFNAPLTVTIVYPSSTVS